MLQNFLKLALRNIARNRLYVLLNILGLGVGIALLVWGYQNWRFAFSWDNFHPQRAQIFRVLVTKRNMEGWRAVCPLPVAEQAKREFASIAEAVRWDSRGCNIKGERDETFSNQVNFTDPAFFDLFNFPLVAGSRDLNDPNAVLLTEEMAKKYFGDRDPIGKTLLFYAGEDLTRPLTVRGVLKNVPPNSSIQFNFITRLENLKTTDSTFLKTDDWKWLADAVFFKIPNPADAPALSKAFDQYVAPQNAAQANWQVSGFRLVSLETMNDQSDWLRANALRARPEDSATYGPLVVALLIFLSACLNFANTTVARSHRRLREMGVRKVLGGRRADLMRQILLECGVLVFVAILLSGVLNHWWIPMYNTMFEGIELQADYLGDPTLLRFLGGVLLFTTLLAGAYPAFYISRFNPSQIFRGGVVFGGSNLFSRLLLGVQIVVSLITVVCGVAFARNAAFQRDYDYGYERAGLMGVWLPDQHSYEALRNATREIPGVQAVAGTRFHIGFGYRGLIAESEQQKQEVNYFEIGENYLNVMGLKLLAGRLPDPAREADYHGPMVITEKAAAGFGWLPGEALGKKIRVDTSEHSVVGVLKDFHQEDLFNPLEAQVMCLAKPDRYQSMIVKAKPADLKLVHDRLKAKWSLLYPLKPFNGFYQDEATAEAFQVTTSIATIFSWFAVVAMLLTATGLFALVSLTVLKKMKEIALRKVVGARLVQILALVNRGYVWIFAVAAAFGCYAGWFLTKLLLDMVFKINVGVDAVTLAVSAGVLFLIAGLTVGFKVRQAAHTNPAEVLRNE